MFRNIQRASRTARLFSTAPKPGVVTRNLSTGSLLSRYKTTTTTTTPKIQFQVVATPITTHLNQPIRNYTTEPPPQNPKDLPWLSFLESASTAPWLVHTPPEPEQKLQRAYSLLFHVILYLGRPLTEDVKKVEEATQQFLLAFNSAPVSPDSEIGRARHAIAILTKAITRDVTSVSQTSDLRSKHSQIFALGDALIPLCDVHLQGVEQNQELESGEVVVQGGDGDAKWQDFWTRAQPIVLALGEELDKAGYGISEELIKEARAEQEKKEKEEEKK